MGVRLTSGSSVQVLDSETRKCEFVEHDFTRTSTRLRTSARSPSSLVQEAYEGTKHHVICVAPTSPVMSVNQRTHSHVSRWPLSVFDMRGMLSVMGGRFGYLCVVSLGPGVSVAHPP